MSDDLTVKVARVLAEDAPHKAWSDCLDRAIALVWNEAIEAAGSRVQEMKDHVSRDECDLLVDVACALDSLRKPEPDQ